VQGKSRELLDQLHMEKQSKAELTSEVKDLRKTLVSAKDIE